GKTSIARSLVTRDKEINMSVSATTRPRRPGEAEGKDYYFVDEEKFKIDINKGLFLEYARVFDHYYGTPLGLVQKLLSSGCDVLFDIDWQGTQQIKAKARDDLVSIFVLPPSTAELEKRLITRAQDSAEVVAGRMARAADEMSHYPEYDYIIVNHDLDQSIDAVHTILKAERLRRSRQASLTEFMKQLREGCS
ncbi:MAG: guanylate kinase, partial [Candidatus Puniceispirillaceae bacterium]